MNPDTGHDTPEAPSGHVRYRLAVAETATEARAGTAPVLAITGLVLWSVQTYLVNPVPYQVSAAIYIVVPSLVGWLMTHIVIKKVTI